MDYDKILIYLQKNGKVISESYDADDINKFKLTNKSDGKGTYISKWEYDIPQPTLEDINSINESEITDLKEKITKKQKIGNDTTSLRFVKLCEMLNDAFNQLDMKKQIDFTDIFN